MNLKFYTGLVHNQWICTLAIGDAYLETYERFVLPFALEYCNRHNFGLVALVSDATDSYSPEIASKKKTWQKLLIPKALMTHLGRDVEVAYYDADILLNPFGKNIFRHSNKSCLGLTKSSSGLPYDDHLCRRIISFYRNKFYSGSYPLDSAIFMPTEQLYRYHNFPPYEDYSCLGLFVCHDSSTANKLSEIYQQYDSAIVGLTEGGDEPFLNYEFRNRFQIYYLDYEFQALWSWEMASRYRHLFQNPYPTTESLNCISSVLLSVTALHFAGSWPDAQLYKDDNLYANVNCTINQQFFNYMQTPVWGVPLGRIPSPS